MKDSITKVALSAALAVIGTGAAAWMVFGQDKVSRMEMHTYVQDKLLPVGRLEKSVEKLVETQKELLIEQRVLVQRFDDFLNDQEGD
jgi:hypothetical protein